MDNTIVVMKKCPRCFLPMPASPELFVKGYPNAICKECWLLALPRP